MLMAAVAIVAALAMSVGAGSASAEDSLAVDNDAPGFSVPSDGGTPRVNEPNPNLPGPYGAHDDEGPGIQMESEPADMGPAIEGAPADAPEGSADQPMDDDYSGEGQAEEP